MLSFWYGNVPLWKSYWLIGELLNALVLFILINLEIYLFQNDYIFVELPYLDFGRFSIISKVIFILWTVYITVGIWRSAEKYKGTIIWIILTLIILCYRIFTLRLIIFN
tara:strand:+ start:165 stop:491 length:327 start_codon:yes stop_codon:yes gene_type:complete